MTDINDTLAAVSRNLQALANREALQADEASRELIGSLSRDLVIVQKAVKVLTADKDRLEYENHQLRAQLAGEHGFDVKNNVYYTPDGDGPFCPVCYEKRGRKQRLRPLDTGDPSVVKHACRVCEGIF